MTTNLNTFYLYLYLFFKQFLKINILLFISFNIQGQNLSVSLENFAIEEGLSQRQVNVVFQDKQGFIWAGTEYGLNRYDGYQFVWWTMERHGLQSNTIKGIVQDADGLIWVYNTYSKAQHEFPHISYIDVIDPNTGEVRPLEEKVSNLGFSLQNAYGIKILSDSTQTLYFGTSGKAQLISYHPQTGFEVKPIDNYSSFIPLCIDMHGYFWGIADEETLIKVDRNGNLLFKKDYKELLHPLQIAFDGTDLWLQIGGPASKAWFEIINLSSHKINAKTWKDFKVPAYHAEDGYYRIFYDPANQYIWGISPYYHAIPIDATNPERDLDINKQLAPYIQKGWIGNRSFIADKTGQIWMGGDFGLTKIEVSTNKFQPLLFKSPPKSSRERFAIRGIVKIDKHLMVSVGNKGLYQVNLTAPTQSYFHHINGFNQTKKIGSFGLVQDGKHAYWAVGSNLFKLEPQAKKLTIFEKKDDITEVVNWTMHIDKQGKLWIGRENGLMTWNWEEEKMEVFDQINNYKDFAKARIVDFVEDDENGIWLCSNQGLYLLDLQKGIIDRYWKGGPAEKVLPHNDIRHLYKDKEGIFWLATGGAGLVRWDRTKQLQESFTRLDGLSNNMIYAVYEDHNNNLWLSSDYGIMQFDKDNYSVQAYVLEDGITNNEFNRTAHYQDEEGKIYFGTIDGINAFDPKDFYFKDSTNTPPLLITEFQQFDGKKNELIDRKAELLEQNTIRMKANDRFFYLRFALLSYARSNQITYAYRIKGWNDKWQYQRENILRLGQLPYGQYQLQIKAQDANGQWSSNELDLEIVVERPFYLQYWFICLVLLMTIGIIFLLYRFNLKRQIDKEKTLRLEEISKLKSRFYTNITHEFRTPLTVILGMTGATENIPKAMELIRRNGQKLLHLINQLLDLAKIDTGHLNIHYKQIEIVSFSQYLGESFQSLAEQKNIRLMIYSELQELYMDIDEDKYQQIISNLLSNAIKFTPESGKIIVHLTQNDAYLNIKVKDNGAGIDKEELPFIFDRFYQVDHTASRQGKGTGIGLALVKELVELLNGQIMVESKLEIGTTFEILLPITTNSPRQEATYAKFHINKDLLDYQVPTLEKEDQNLPQLLIIEDNPDVVLYIQSILKDFYQIDIAPNGEVGIEKAIANTPDIVICDIMMPKKDGYEVLATLKEDPRSSHIPIVILTAKAAQEDKIRGLKFGADAYLMKPFDKEELLIRIKNLIQSRQKTQEEYTSIVNSNLHPQNQEEQFLLDLQHLMEQKLNDAELNVEEMANSLSMSRSQLYRKLKALTDQTPSQFIRTIRLREATKLLKNEMLNISEVAYEVGFTDPNYFIRLFSKEFGISPNAYRKRHKTNKL